MLVLEAKWSGGRCPLNALPKGPRRLPSRRRTTRSLSSLETLTNGETPALLQMEAKDFAALLPLLADHPNITLGKASAVTVTQTPLKLAAARHAGGEWGNCPGVEGQDGGVRAGRRLGLAGADVAAAGLAARREGYVSRAGARAARASAAVPEPAMAAIAGGRRHRRPISGWRISRSNRRRRAFCWSSKAAWRN